MDLPARIRDIIDRIANAHEVTADMILSPDSHRAVELARIECYRAVAEAPKPNGRRPTTAEIARWFNRSWPTIHQALQKDAA